MLGCVKRIVPESIDAPMDLISELEATKVNHRLGIRWLVRVVGFRIYDRIASSGSNRNFSAYYSISLILLFHVAKLPQHSHCNAGNNYIVMAQAEIAVHEI